MAKKFRKLLVKNCLLFISCRWQYEKARLSVLGGFYAFLEYLQDWLFLAMMRPCFHIFTIRWQFQFSNSKYFKSCDNTFFVVVMILLSDRQLSTFGLLYHIFIASAYKKCIQNWLKFTPFICKLYFNKFIKDQKKSVKFCSIGLFCETVKLHINVNELVVLKS